MAVPARKLIAQPPRPRLRLVVDPPPTPARRVGPARQPAGVYRRRRLTAALAGLLLVATVMAAAFGVGAAVGGSAGSVSAPEPGRVLGQTVVVQPGDTVWGLATRHLPPGTDPRAYVAEVLAVNRMQDGRVRPGEVLRLPSP